MHYSMKKPNKMHGNDITILSNHLIHLVLFCLTFVMVVELLKAVARVGSAGCVASAC